MFSTICIITAPVTEQKRNVKDLRVKGDDGGERIMSLSKIDQHCIERTDNMYIHQKNVGSFLDAIIITVFDYVHAPDKG